MAYGLEIHDKEGRLLVDNSTLIARLTWFSEPEGPFWYGDDYGYGGANWTGGGWPTNDTPYNEICCNGNEDITYLDAVMPPGISFSNNTTLAIVRGPVIKKNMDQRNDLPSNDSAIKLTSVMFQPTKINSGPYRITTLPENGQCRSCSQNNDWNDTRNEMQVIVAYFG